MRSVASVYLFVRALKGKRLELSPPKSVLVRHIVSPRQDLDIYWPWGQKIKGQINPKPLSMSIRLHIFLDSSSQSRLFKLHLSLGTDARLQIRKMRMCIHLNIALPFARYRHVENNHGVIKGFFSSFMATVLHQNLRIESVRMWNTAHQCGHRVTKKISYWLKECSIDLQGWFPGFRNCHMVKDWDDWDFGV